VTDRELLENIVRLVQMDGYEEVIFPLINAYVMYHVAQKVPHEKLEKQYFMDCLKEAEEYLKTTKEKEGEGIRLIVAKMAKLLDDEELVVPDMDESFRSDYVFLK
jgi:hypothetical protein